MNPTYRTENEDALASQFESSLRPGEPPGTLDNASPQHAAARGLGKMLGLHPISGVTTVAANAMLFTGTVMTMGALVPVAIIVAAVLGFITYKAQRCFYADNHDAALVKALAVALLTAIPVGLPMFLMVPSAVVGVVHTIRRKG
jgi:hypothetical protein